MRRLILMRHAKAGWPAGIATDFDRPLDDKGRQDAHAIGRWLDAEDYRPDLVLCSASRRTSETLELLEIPSAVKRIFTDRLYLADTERLMAAIQGAEGSTVLLLAHNPGVAEMAHLLPRVGAIAHLAAGTPPGATMVMSFEVDDWRGVHWHSGDVQAYMTPRMLAQ
ncbi:phosphohistidine phosphatase [Sulfitobacter pontiacus]|jgi:phosphohistidine phosphatase|uniref:Phosphohistidine phosphatase n=1 Tax=Sulfitobacter pontiacus TaxID=60137 RepID=A0A1H2RZ07_9RHOB|nr:MULTISPECIES: histidine phosphatase family protein [Sulfitobacter]OAN82718.1 phosphoglycerate mutase [Sulfitobacter pontiacus]QPO08500.1 histidine phosphatase family protein [Sulfitobacter sp. B30-2]SDW24548.1 phosphohistidine phosphatase [Sulfitobacter pontiacus]